VSEAGSLGPDHQPSAQALLLAASALRRSATAPWSSISSGLMPELSPSIRRELEKEFLGRRMGRPSSFDAASPCPTLSVSYRDRLISIWSDMAMSF